MELKFTKLVSHLFSFILSGKQFITSQPTPMEPFEQRNVLEVFYFLLLKLVFQIKGHS